MFKLDLEKAEEPEIKLPTSAGSSKKQENSRKTSTSASLTMLKPLLCGSQQTGKFFKRWEYQTTLPASCETCMQVKKQQLETDMEQQTGSILGKEYVLAYMKSASCEMLGWMKHKLESRLPGEISISQVGRWHHSYSKEWSGTKETLESEREEWKSWLKI